MKTPAILAALLAAFALVGEIDYQTAAGVAAEHLPSLSRYAAVQAGDPRHE